VSSSSGAARDPRAAVCHAITMLELAGRSRIRSTRSDTSIRPAFGRCSSRTGRDPRRRRGPPSGRRVRDLPALVRPVAPLQDLQALWDLWRVSAASAHDRAHALIEGGIVGRLAAFLAGTPVIVHSVHGWGFHPHQHGPSVSFSLCSSGRPRWSPAGSSRSPRQRTARSGARNRAARAIHGHPLRDRTRCAPRRGRQRPPALGTGPRADTPLAGMVACLKPQKRRWTSSRWPRESPREFPGRTSCSPETANCGPRSSTQWARRGLRGAFTCWVGGATRGRRPATFPC